MSISLHYSAKRTCIPASIRLLGSSDIQCTINVDDDDMPIPYVMHTTALGGPKTIYYIDEHTGASLLSFSGEVYVPRVGDTLSELNLHHEYYVTKVLVKMITGECEVTCRKIEEEVSGHEQALNVHKLKELLKLI